MSTHAHADQVIPRRTLSPPQERALLRKHLTGDFGPHRWSVIEALIAGGYVVEHEHGKTLAVTPKGQAYCDAHHVAMTL